MRLWNVTAEVTYRARDSEEDGTIATLSVLADEDGMSACELAKQEVIRRGIVADAGQWECPPGRIVSVKIVGLAAGPEVHLVALSEFPPASDSLIAC